ncbi:aldo/keto reductase [Streptomyces sp. TLI_171]|uniref:aldo/keto reductase n=1 Tax=Streptomyces sp. TLI_171 TaxID=1938859 RepID=UPI000C19C8F9|nr:aldo/keto reductase [Streptomyces sp. TLI_171]RKE22076.1 diketogulonate reductase-like aldo/keto reductase [Streptomyces sp. TLI_171]RKE22144.1 diketogulonate reductase-like aldo/keto reductase [Streptomyces sp. TLI_171]
MSSIPAVPAIPTVTLNNGVRIPQLGFGVWQVPDAEAVPAVRTAIEAGYRSIDTAAIYENEAGTGRAIAESGVARDELFVTTKLWNSGTVDWSGEQGRDRVRRAFDESLAKLGLDQLDLYLIHWPRPMHGNTFLNIWPVFEQLQAEGRVRAIGVSNFRVPDLELLLKETSVVPALNQVELHPYFPQAELRAFHAEHGIATEAWSPLGQGGDLLAEPALLAVAAKHGRSAAQVVLRWHLQSGVIAIPKSVTPARIRENLDVTGFELDAEDLAAVAGVATGKRIGPDPADFDWN